jgi:hypothetical protein
MLRVSLLIVSALAITSLAQREPVLAHYDKCDPKWQLALYSIPGVCGTANVKHDVEEKATYITLLANYMATNIIACLGQRPCTPAVLSHWDGITDKAHKERLEEEFGILIEEPSTSVPQLSKGIQSGNFAFIYDYEFNLYLINKATASEVSGVDSRGKEITFNSSRIAAGSLIKLKRKPWEVPRRPVGNIVN